MRDSLMGSRVWALGMALVWASLSATRAGEDAPDADARAVKFFETEVRPLFVAKCQKCHGPRQQRGGLRLDSLAATNPWLRFWLSHDPATTLRRVRQPVLLLHGATDWQVPPDEAGVAAAALRAGGNRDVTVRVLSGINHLFLADPEPVPSVEHYAGLTSKTVPPEVLGVLVDWLAARLAR